MSEHVRLRDRGIRLRSFRTGGKPGGQMLEVGQGRVELVDPSEIPDQPRQHVCGLGLRGEVTPSFGTLAPASRVAERFVVRGRRATQRASRSRAT